MSSKAKKCAINDRPYHPSIFHPHTQFAAFVLTSISLLVVLTALPIRYETNDDLSYITELSGFCPTPVSFVLNPLTGYALYGLYRLFPAVPWYGILVYGCIWLGIFLAAGVFLRFSSRFLFLIAAPILFILVLRSYAFLGLTTASLLLLFSVFLSHLEWSVKRGCPLSTPGRYSGILTAGLLLAFALRWELVSYCMVLAAPLLLIHPLTLFQRKSSFVAAAVILLLSIVNFAYLQSGDNHAYNVYSKLRKKFHDTDKGYPHGAVTIAALQKTGWDWDDYVLFRDYWFVYDRHRFNAEKLSVFLEANDPKTKLPLVRHIQDRVSYAYRENKKNIHFLAASFALILLYGFTRSRAGSFRKTIARLAAFGIVLSSMLFLMYYRFEPRVYLPLFLYLFGSAAVLFCDDPQSLIFSHRLTPVILWVAMSALAALTWGQAALIAKDFHEDLLASDNNRRYLKNALKRFETNLSDAEERVFFIMNPLTNLMVETVHPLQEKKELSNLAFIPFGWQINSRQYDSILAHLNLENGRELLKWTVDNRNAVWCWLLLKPEENNLPHRITNYFNRHIVSDRRVAFRTISDYRDRNGTGIVFFYIETETTEYSGCHTNVPI